jgi:hypothetical protein
VHKNDAGASGFNFFATFGDVGKGFPAKNTTKMAKKYQQHWCVGCSFPKTFPGISDHLIQNFFLHSIRNHKMEILDETMGIGKGFRI